MTSSRSDQSGTATMDERLAGRESAVPPVPPLRALPAGRRRLAGPVLGQLIAVELVAFAVAVAVGRQVWLLVAVGVPALVTVALLLGRWRGRWWYQQLTLRLRYLRAERRARREGGGDPDPRRAAARELMPELDIVDVTERGGTFGIGYDGTGWFVALAVSGPARDPGAALPLRALAGLVDGSLSRLQVVTHTVPAVVTRLNAWAPVAASYVEVSAKLTGPVPPAETATYLVVRLDTADALAVAAQRGGGTLGVRRALAAAVRRVGRTLSAAGVEHRALDADELYTALAVSLGLAPVPPNAANPSVPARPSGPAVPAGPSGPVFAAGPSGSAVPASPSGSAVPVNPSGSAVPAGRRTAAAWDRLTVDGYPQACYQVIGWPPHGDRLAACLDATPAAWHERALVLGPRTDRVSPEEVPVRGYLRVAAEPHALAAVCAALTAAAGLQGVGLRRLDGEHVAATYTTAPTGGVPAVGAPGHACPMPAFDALATPVPDGGVLLGRDPDHRPVLVPLFESRPLRVVVIGGLWPGRVVLMRCLAAGARVVAAPGQPDWVSLGRWATGSDHWVAPPGALVPPSHPAAPVLVAVDAAGPGPAIPPSGWRSTVTTAARPTPELLSGADILLTARLAPPDAGLVADTYGLEPEPARLLTRMYEDMLAVVRPGTVRYAWPTPSPAEQEILTPPNQPQPILGAIPH